MAALGVAAVTAVAAPQRDYTRLRSDMVEKQLRARDITDKNVLRAMGKVPRHEFVPASLRSQAYADRPLPIGEGQTISQPYIVALMTQVAKVKRGDKVLEIGTGSGYQAAILAELTPHVYTIEIVPSLAKRAQGTLKRLDYKTVKARIGDGYKGWREHAPFDAIVVTCAPDHIPQPLANQLAEGGRMVIPVGKQDALRGQQLLLVEKIGGKLKVTSIAPVLFVPMVREKGTQ
ncbi:MAG: protein-L-isoaspartate(D-aspartate) O-methyltransferase [Armatimonadota bacterium]|nr:MAG: protein-L-isoaspartate(D-aspartate) O-methyltransferase [Armatimonadota bacterium]